MFVLWTALACTDGVDGWIARRHGTTRSGAFLDPLADKVLVLGALYSLASIGRFAWLPVVIIAVREVAISLYRVYWGRRGLAVPGVAGRQAEDAAARTGGRRRRHAAAGPGPPVGRRTRCCGPRWWWRC